jgi:hypothetical protein
MAIKKLTGGSGEGLKNKFSIQKFDRKEAERL